jgi:dihydroneopterin aldolase/2-amino-4-hydroxy-6-hydroxymethyldihydropteridine diphosphokinase
MTSDSTVAYIGIGSNLGDKISNCRRAIEEMGHVPGCQVAACSALFKTEPEGVIEQDWFINCVSKVTTELSPIKLIKALLSIEHAMGRRRRKRWEARIIDLDILLFGQEVMRSHDLVIPHPLLHKRRFVLAPLAQLAPDLIHPVLKTTIVQLLHGLPKGPSVDYAGELV